jgi:hypothetical protein
MKVLISMALTVLATIAQAQTGEDAVLRGDAKAASRVEKAQPRPLAKSFQTKEIQRDQVAGVGVSLTDDWEAVTLPAFATRTTRVPFRFLRVAVQWSF